MIDLNQMTRDALVPLGLELVSVERAPMGLLRVTIDRPQGVSIEDCEQASHQLSRVYEVEGLEYRRLEVGSPGVDRPLRTPEDFERFLGERVEVRLKQAIDSHKTFVGQLFMDDKATGEARGAPVYVVAVETKKGNGPQIRFTFDDVERANLNPLLDFRGKKR